MSLQRQLLRTPLHRALPSALPACRRLYATGDYGSGEGDPRGGKPQDQGSNPSADKEHPGPPPPKAGEGSGGGPTKGDAKKGHNTEQSQQQQQQKRDYGTYAPLRARRAFLATQFAQQKRAFGSSAGMRAASKKEDRPKTTEGLGPKIYSETPPKDEDLSEEVKQHNQELAGRAERTHEKVEEEDYKNDTVHKGYWKGQGGSDKEP